jgi:hypothetical protein
MWSQEERVEYLQRVYSCKSSRVDTMALYVSW